MCDETSPTWNEETQTCSEVEPPSECTPESPTYNPETGTCAEVSPPSGGPIPPAEVVNSGTPGLLPSTGAAFGVAGLAAALLLSLGGIVLMARGRKGVQ